MTSTRENTESVQELHLSQESQLGTHQSVRDITRETSKANKSHQVTIFGTQHLKLKFSISKM